MRRDDAVLVRHVVDAAREAIGMAKDRSREDLDTDRKVNLSLVRLLEIIGEAAKNISPGFRQKHPDLPRRKMVGMRDRLIHGYFDINFDVVWQTVTEDLPALVANLEETVAQ